MRLIPSSISESLIAVLRIFLLLTTVIVIALFFCQEKLIFHPQTLSSDFKFEFASAFEERWINFQGLKINSLLFRSKESKGVILYFHGNAGSLEEWGNVAEELSKRTDWDVWIVDYPGFGKSEGTISSEDQLHDLAEMLWSYSELEYGSKKRIVFGRSIGTGLASKLATKHQTSGLILESPYLSLPALAKNLLPWIPTALLRYELHNDELLQIIKCPILIIHGTSDEIIPFAQGKELASLNSNTTFQPIDRGHHNDLSTFEDYWIAITKWIETK